MADGDYKTGFVADFDPPLEKKHECPVCMCALRDPIQTACGHRFCTECVKQISLKPRPKCPLDNEQLNRDEIFPDNFCKREVLSLTVRCSNKSKGCNWLGALKDLENHEKLCDFTVTVCPNEGCEVTIPVKDLAHHQEHDCKFRTIRCAICGNPIIFNQQREHFSRICPDIEIECENACGMKLKRKEMPEHLSTQCQNMKVVCPFRAVSCSYESTRLEVEQHQAEKLQDHLALMLSRMSELMSSGVGEASVLRISQQQQHLPESRHEAAVAVSMSTNTSVGAAHSSAGVDSGLLQNDVAAVAAQVNSLMGDISALNEQVQERDRTIQEQGQQIEEMRSVMRQLQESVQQFSSEVGSCHREVAGNSSRISSFEQKHTASQGKVATIEHRQVAIEKSIAIKDNALAEHDVRLLSLESTSYDGILRWKITEFNRRKSEAIAGRRLSIYSPPFFTSRHGYKMCSRIYLNGDGMGKGSHLSLFFVVMKGEYDSLLPWPFQQRVTFTLIDQEHRRHVSDTFQPDPASSSFQRPAGDMNVASGCPLFVPLEALETRGYVKDDTMFIRVAVDIKGLVHP